MEYHEIKKQIESGNPAPVYFFFGEETCPVELLLNQIKQAIDPATLDFNFDVMNAMDVDVEQAISVAASFPMMAEKRVLVLKNIQRCTSTDQKRILAYIENPSETTTFILTAGKIDRRKSFYAKLVKKSQWMESKPLYENQAVGWVQRFVQNRGLRISAEAATYLVEQSGTSLHLLANEIHKICTFAPEAKEIQLETVSAVVGGGRHFNTWEFTNAVAGRNLNEAYTILFHMLEDRQSPIGLIIDLSRRVLLLFRIRILLDRGYTSSKISSVMHFKPFFARLYFEQASKFKTPELQSCLQVLMKTDRAIKTGYLPPEIAMVLLTRDIISNKKELFFK